MNGIPALVLVSSLFANAARAGGPTCPDGHTCYFSPDRTRLAYVAGRHPQKLYLIGSNQAEPRAIKTLPVFLRSFSAVWSPNGRKLAVQFSQDFMCGRSSPPSCQGESSIAVYDAEKFRLIGEYSSPQSDAGVSENRRKVYRKQYGSLLRWKDNRTLVLKGPLEIQQVNGPKLATTADETEDSAPISEALHQRISWEPALGDEDILGGDLTGVNP